jgi:hypothetical protein
MGQYGISWEYMGVNGKQIVNRGFTKTSAGRLGMKSDPNWPRASDAKLFIPTRIDKKCGEIVFLLCSYCGIAGGMPWQHASNSWIIDER